MDMIIQNIGRGGLANLSFTVSKEDVPRADKVMVEVIKTLGGGNLQPKADIFAHHLVMVAGHVNHIAAAAGMAEDEAQDFIVMLVPGASGTW